MKISVLIATRNRPGLLRAALRSIQQNQRLPDEIVVIDQSGDGTSRAVVEEFKATLPNVVHEPMAPLGKSKALNRAIEIASGRFLVFTDDDVRVDEHWLETFDKLIAQYPQAGAFCGRMLPETGSSPEDYLNLVLRQEPGWIDRRYNPLNSGFVGANMGVRRETLINVGGFNELFGPGALFRSNNDGELAHRLVRSGTDIMFCPELVVYHSAWRKESDNRDLKFNYAFGLGAFPAYYLKQGDVRPFFYLCAKFPRKLRRLLIGVCLLQKERMLDGYLHIKGFILGFWKGLVTSAKKRLPQ
ncbi:MAG: glycosyltransferase [Nitrospinae bacterium]|nr:glycosyltransferase [Nitrospinota bacterium]